MKEQSLNVAKTMWTHVRVSRLDNVLVTFRPSVKYQLPTQAVISVALQVQRHIQLYLYDRSKQVALPSRKLET